jgi:transposase
VAARKQKQKQMSAQVVEDEDYQLRYEVAAGVDVAKDSGVVCVRMPPAGGRKHRTSHLQTVTATVPAITQLAAELTAAGVQMVSMEATSDYWRIWVRHEAHCCIARSAGGNRRRCFSDLMAYQGPKG